MVNVAQRFDVMHKNAGRGDWTETVKATTRGRKQGKALAAELLVAASRSMGRARVDDVRDL